MAYLGILQLNKYGLSGTILQDRFGREVIIQGTRYFMRHEWLRSL